MTMRRPQFTLRSLLVAMLVVAAFFAGIRFERERQRRQDLAEQTMAIEATAGGQLVNIAVIDPSSADHVGSLLERNGIVPIIEGSVVYGVSVSAGQVQRALSLLRADAAAQGYWVRFN